jgi:hypothetical protein
MPKKYHVFTLVVDKTDKQNICALARAMRCSRSAAIRAVVARASRALCREQARLLAPN